jgi:hypothetical protein
MKTRTLNRPRGDAAPPHARIAGNPILAGLGFTDPHVTVHGGRAYCFATHDFAPDNSTFIMKDWWLWSSRDLVHWEHESTLRPEETYLKRPFDDCWATFGVFRNGRWYWYLSCGPTEIGVVVADSPKGPWRDPLGKPLVPKGLTPTEQRDPDILIDDDGVAYMVFGTFDYYIARLGDDMVSLAEKPRRLHIDKPFGPYGAGRTDDKPSLHKRNGIYYLSWSSFYAMSESLYGPYVYKGSVIDPGLVAPEFQFEHLHHDRHGNFFDWNGQGYYIFNDKSQPGRSGFFRDSCISYVHYRDNGEIAPIRLDRTGVGQYDATSARIEAEDYSMAVGAEKRECPFGGFEMRGLTDGSVLLYPQVRDVRPHSRFSFRVSSAAPRGGTIEVREGGADSPLLGVCAVPSTGGWDQYQTVCCELATTGGMVTLCLAVKGDPGELMRLDWFNLRDS